MPTDKKKAPAAKKAPKDKNAPVVETSINLEVLTKATIKLNGMKLILTAGQNGVQIRSADKLSIDLENDRCLEVYER